MANRREFMRTLSGVAALSITTDVSRLGRARFLRMASAMPTPIRTTAWNRIGTGARLLRCNRR